MTSKTYALETPASGRNVPVPPVASDAINSLAGCDLCSIRDLSWADVRLILDTARAVKAQPELYRHALDAKQLVMFFEKDSLRTRLTFETGINTLGGSAIFIDQTASRLGARETLADVAHNLERWVNVIVLRTYAHATVTGMAEYARVPVVNALSDVEHPCQALTDIFTLEEHFGDLRGLNNCVRGRRQQCGPFPIAGGCADGREHHAGFARRLWADGGVSRGDRAVDRRCSRAGNCEVCQQSARSGCGGRCRLYRRVDQHGTGE